MNKPQLEQLFSKASPRPVCPGCGSTNVAFSAVVSVCGSCSWFGDTAKPTSKGMDTDLSRFLISQACRTPGGERSVSYSTEITDPEERVLFLQRAIERHGMIIDGRDAVGLASQALAALAENPEFTHKMWGAGSELWIAAHSPSSGFDRIGGYAIYDGHAFTFGNHLVDIPIETLYNPRRKSMPVSEDVAVEILSLGSGWDFRERIGAQESMVFCMRAAPEGEARKLGVEPESLFEVRYSDYNFYPRRILLTLPGWTDDYSKCTPVEIDRAEGVAQWGFSLKAGDSTSRVFDRISNQAVAWSPISLNFGGDSGSNLYPRYLAVVASGQFSSTCCVSESLDEAGKFIALAAVRGTPGPGKKGRFSRVPREEKVDIRSVNGASPEEAIENIAARNLSFQESGGGPEKVRIFQKEWDILQSDPLSIAFEVRSFGCWTDPLMRKFLMSRKSGLLQ